MSRDVKMNDLLYMVDGSTKELEAVEPLAFSALGIKERQDLQEWVLKTLLFHYK